MNRTLIAALIFVGGLTFATPAVAVSRDTAALKRALGSNVRVAEHRETGKVRFVGTTAGKPIARPSGLSRSASPALVARAFFGSYGAAFGIRDQATELRVIGTEAGTGGRSAVRFQQLHAGVPVLGGELVVNLDADRNVLSANGEALPDAKVATSPQVGSAAAREAAVAAVAKTHAGSPIRLKATVPSLWIYDSRILGGPGLARPVLVWRLEVKGGDGAVNELVLVDAANGSVALRIDQIENALPQRVICDAANSSAQYPCASPVRVEGGPTSTNAEVNQAYDYAGHTFDFFSTHFGRNSVDNQGHLLTSTVRYCEAGCPFINAFWDGQQTVFGPGVMADDVVGHEFTHAVTQFTANLFYYYQSGAINESISDVFGEFIDLTNGVGDDTAGVRWLVGEDITAAAEFRNMANPPAKGDPDTMTSPNYTADPDDDNPNNDSGGVHTNSGVNNKAAFLMTDGESFHGHNVIGLGIPKVARIYYTVLTTMLTSASDYADLGSALQQACVNLASTGTAGITAGDCTQVNEAVAATEMSTNPPVAPTTAAPVCPSGLVATSLFSDDIENPASGKWTTQAGWSYPQTSGFYGDNQYATSGTKNMWGDNRPSAGDTSITMTSNVAIPAGSTAFLRFNHAYGFEDDSAGAYDGGMLEVSVNGGAFTDAGSLLTEGGYNGTLTTISNNPLEGRNAFVRESNGYGASRATLSSLAGQTVRFRFRIGTDGSLRDRGWFIDDVGIYTCAAPAPPPPPPAPPAVVAPVVVAPALANAKVKSCSRTGRGRKTRVSCILTGFGAVSRVTLKVTRRGKTVASGSAKPSKAGKLTIKGKRTLRRGSYRVKLTLRDASGKTRTLTKTLRVR
jgi:bacillolysin